MTEALDMYQIIEDAKEVLKEENKWLKGTMAIKANFEQCEPESPEASKYCLLGALTQHQIPVYNPPPGEYDGYEDTELHSYQAQFTILELTALIIKAETEHNIETLMSCKDGRGKRAIHGIINPCKPPTETVSREIITKFNDADTTTYEDITNVLNHLKTLIIEYYNS